MARTDLQPFINNAQRVLGLAVDAAGSGAVGGSDHEFVVSVGLTGPRPGTVIARFPRSTAHRAASLFAGREIAPVDDESIADALAEILDIIAGRTVGAAHARSCPLVTIRRGVDGEQVPGQAEDRAECFCAAGGFTMGFRTAMHEVGRITPGAGIAAQAA